jgi:hypothetical protein
MPTDSSLTADTELHQFIHYENRSNQACGACRDGMFTTSIHTSTTWTALSQKPSENPHIKVESSQELALALKHCAQEGSNPPAR